MNKISGDKLDTLFLFPPGGENGYDHFFYSLGSAYIITFLRQHGFKAEQFTCREFINLENCIRKILLFNPGVVGFTVFNTNLLTSVLIAGEIKKLFPEKIIAFGGPTATNYSEFILGRYPVIDVCFRNEGEETFLQFLSRLAESNFKLKNAVLTGIRGITYRFDDRIWVNPDSNILADNSGIPDYLDKYPSPFLTGVIPGRDAFITGLLTARGCNQHCTYCNCAVLSKRRITTHSVERVISELDYLSSYKDDGRVLSFFDDAFSLIPQRAKRICRAIIENKIRLPLSCITRCDRADEELLDLMKEAGFVSVAFSLESANPRTLRIIGKVNKAEDNPSDALEKENLFIERIGNMAAYAKKIGIKSVFSSIMSGLPFETLDEANRTIEKIDSCPDIDSCSHNLLAIYHGTPLYDTHGRYGYKLDLPDDNPVFSKTVYPDNVVCRVKTSLKSHYREIQKKLHNSTARILSLAHEDKPGRDWFSSIVLFSDIVDSEFVSWLKMILALNGPIIQIYSDENALSENSDKNHETFIRYCTPSLDIRNYYFERAGKLPALCHHSPLIRNENERIVLQICDFGFVKSHLADPGEDFAKLICRESGPDDAGLAHTYFSDVKEEKNLFDFLINTKPYPWFANLCKWTRDFSNCRDKNTLFVNDRSELRLCWYGPQIGRVGLTYAEIAGNFESYQKLVSEQRKCMECSAGEYCNKCISPFPLGEEDYCNRQRNKDISDAAELVMSLDVFKQFI